MAAYVLYVGITENCDQRRNTKRQTKSQRTVCNMLISFRPVRRRMAPGTTRLHIGVTRSPTATHRVLQTQSAARLRNFVLLSYPLPLQRGEYAAAVLHSMPWERWAAVSLTLTCCMLRFVAHRLLASIGEKGCWRPFQPDITDSLHPEPEQLSFVDDLLAGRILLHHEVLRMLADEGEGIITALPDDIIEHLVADGRLHRQAALQQSDTGEWRCRRCFAQGRVNIGPCVRCQRETCVSCAQCAPYGVARACEAVYVGRAFRSQHAVHTSSSAPLLNLQYELSPAQARAAASLRHSQYSRALVWAACGAGKTEVVFSVIEHTLQQGLPVLFAVPRRDIAIELGERFTQAFSSVRIQTLYGGAPRRYGTAQLTIATTHQVLRFAQQFPLIVLDEVDAFPYRGNTMLRRAVQRALTRDGRFVYMTATPSDAMLRLAQEHDWHMVTIPARYHGYPLPEPVFRLMADLSALRQHITDDPSNIVPSEDLADHIRHIVKSEQPHLIFVPAIRLVQPTAAFVNAVYRRITNSKRTVAYGTHAGDARRLVVRTAFEQGDFPVLVATTVFERGITIPNVHVTVLWADDERIFDTATLIQMAGRVGRTLQYPAGHVYFLASRLTSAMKSAKRHIQHLNNEARREGFLRSDI